MKINEPLEHIGGVGTRERADDPTLHGTAGHGAVGNVTPDSAQAAVVDRARPNIFPVREGERLLRKHSRPKYQYEIFTV